MLEGPIMGIVDKGSLAMGSYVMRLNYIVVKDTFLLLPSTTLQSAVIATYMYVLTIIQFNPYHSGSS